MYVEPVVVVTLKVEEPLIELGREANNLMDKQSDYNSF